MSEDVGKDKAKKPPERRIFVIGDIPKGNEFAVFANLAFAYNFPMLVPMIIVKGKHSDVLENLLFEISRMCQVVRVDEDYQIDNTLMLSPNLKAVNIALDVMVVNQAELGDRAVVAVIRTVGRDSLALTLACIMYCNKIFKHTHIVGDLGKCASLVRMLKEAGMSITHTWAMDGVGPMCLHMFDCADSYVPEQLVLTLPDDFAFRMGDVMSLIGRLLSYKDKAWSVTSFPRERYMEEKGGLEDCRKFPILAVDMCLMKAKLATRFLEYADQIGSIEYMAEDLVLTKLAKTVFGLQVGYSDDLFRPYHLKGRDKFNLYSEVPEVQTFYKDVVKRDDWTLEEVMVQLLDINVKVGEHIKNRG